jgi:IclR family pca regulon transcriptional regulator
MTKLRAEDVERRLQAGQGKDYLEVLARSIRVIESLGATTNAPTLSDLARATDLPKPSVRRILHTLCALGYAETSGRTFSLTPKVMRLATSYLGRNGNSRVLQAACDRLARETGQSCLVGVLDGEHVLVVAYTMPKDLLAPSLGVGALLPAFCTAAGRILLGQLPDPELDAYLKGLDPVPQTELTITDKKVIRAEIMRARQADRSVMENEYTMGWKTIAYPLKRHDGSLFGTISLNCKNFPPIPDDDFARLAEMCRAQAEALGSIIV